MYNLGEGLTYQLDHVPTALKWNPPSSTLPNAVFLVVSRLPNSYLFLTCANIFSTHMLSANAALYFPETGKQQKPRIR